MKQFKIPFQILVLVVFFNFSNAQRKLSKHQPFSSYWFIDELLKWNPETDINTKFNISHLPLKQRFTDSVTQISPALSTKPSIVSLIAPHPTNSHPSQGFQTVEQYAFPYWQYIDYLVQWGGSAAEGIIVTPTTFWIESAHLNGVEILGTVFFPPNVYGGKEEWVREFLQQDTNGNFPVADKLIEVAKVYGFEGWFINQETNGMEKKEADLMQAFLKYYQKKSNASLKIMWYDAMIEDGRVIWQDELNHHNSIYFQNGDEKLSDIMFLDFGWSETQLEDSHKRAKELNRSPWDLFSGIDVQGKSYKTPTNWNGLYKNEKPYTTSIGLYWPNSTFNIAKDKQPESVYDEEQKFWNGTILEEDVPAWQSKEWKGFSKYIPARSVISALPFVTNFNYGLGRFYNEEGKPLSTREWHNLSIQDILPTWQWQVDSTEVKANFDFTESYTGGSSVKFQAVKRVKNIKIPLYKTALELSGSEMLSFAIKGSGTLNLVIYTNNGSQQSFLAETHQDWTKSQFSLSELKGLRVIKVEALFTGNKNEFVNLGSLSITEDKASSIKKPKVKVTPFFSKNKIELYVHIEGDKRAKFHNIYYLNNNQKIWLGKTRSADYYVAPFDIKESKNSIKILVESIAKDGTRSKVSRSTAYLK
ncbi:endo-beta-N-acetylglucosaminidase [Algibacter aquimarinus]|uniref:Cytosolic endo-beta-N-acetylglucosaminidase TIM barrel domain-containing protein n=1 Tax=Algibacter aquimarinus TaxID=1136748 RepID=A0ABP9H8K5_9FLAO